MIDLTPETDLRTLLRDSIRLIKRNKPNLSSSALAVQLEIAGSTFGRIENGEAKRPDLQHTIAIVSSAHGADSVQAVINAFYPEVARNFEKAYKGNGDVPFVAPDAERFFCDATTHELMVAATCNAGLSRESIQSDYGKKGLTVLESMLASGILEENEGKICFKGKINARQSTVHQLAANLIQHNYDLDAFGSKENWLTLQYESVNDEALGLIREILTDTAAKLRKVYNDPSYQGNKVVWTTLASDTLVKQGIRKEVLQ